MEVAVVGGGFAGLITARTLAKRGFNVTLYEEHSRVGYPPHCTGLVSTRTVELIGDPAKESIEGVFDKVIFRAEGHELVIRVKGVARLDRVRLENLLAEELRSYGVSLRFESPVTTLKHASDGVSLIVRGERREYDYVVLAEGLHGNLRKLVGVVHEPLTSLGLNTDYKVDAIGDGIEVIINPELHSVPYAWAFSLEGYTVVGALGWKPGEVRQAITSIASEKGLARSTRIYGGRVIHGPPLDPRKLPFNVGVVGDAAALNKPLTGGGLFPNALLASKLDFKLSTGLDLNEAFLQAYKDVHRLLARQYHLAKHLLDPAVLALLVRHASIAGLEVGVEDPVDYDDHRGLVRHVFKEQPFRTLKMGVRMLITNPLVTLKILAGALL